MLVVNLIGAPGSGKSTMAAEIFAELKKKSNKRIELVTEYAKEITYQENGMALADQMLITAMHNHRLFMLKDKVDIVIADSSLLNALAYAEYSKNPDFNRVATDAAQSLFSLYNNFNVFVNPQGKFQKYGRSQDEETALKINKKLYQVFIDFKKEAKITKEIISHNDVESLIMEIINYEN